MPPPKRTASARKLIGHSGPEDGLELFLDFGFLDVLSERKFLHQECLRLVEKLALTEGEILVVLEQEQRTQHFRNLLHLTGMDLLHILAITPIPGLVIERGRLFLTQDLVNLFHFLLL